MTGETTHKELDDHALLDEAKRLATKERAATAALLRVLMEVDTRRLYLGESCASMFAWCTQALHLSEGGAYNRIEVARAARAFPAILMYLEQGAVTLTTVRLLAPHLTPDNHTSLLDAARYKSKREVEALVAARQPKPDAPTIVRRLPAAGRPDSLLREPACTQASQGGAIRPAAGEGVRGGSPPVSPARVAPLAADRYRIQVTVSRDTHDKLRRAQDLLRHAVPTGDAAAILDRALTLLVEHLERRRFAATSRPRPARLTSIRSRHVPATVRREVWRRDGGRCTFLGVEGRCMETAFLEFHHVEPYAVGGEATAENIQLRCRAHNGYEARLFFEANSVGEAHQQWNATVCRDFTGIAGRLDESQSDRQ